MVRVVPLPRASLRRLPMRKARLLEPKVRSVSERADSEWTLAGVSTGPATEGAVGM